MGLQHFLFFGGILNILDYLRTQVSMLFIPCILIYIRLTTSNEEPVSLKAVSDRYASMVSPINNILDGC